MGATTLFFGAGLLFALLFFVAGSGGAFFALADVDEQGNGHAAASITVFAGKALPEVEFLVEDKRFRAA